MKAVVWMGSAYRDLCAFPRAARQRAGFELCQVQEGMAPSDWKWMSSVGLGVQELRVRVHGQFRVLYVAKFASAIYVLHAFEKKTQATPKRDLNIARVRFREIPTEG